MLSQKDGGPTAHFFIAESSSKGRAVVVQEKGFPGERIKFGRIDNKQDHRASATGSWLSSG